MMKKKRDKIYTEMIEHALKLFKKSGGTIHQVLIRNTGGSKLNLPDNVISYGALKSRLKIKYPMHLLTLFKVQLIDKETGEGFGYKDNPNFKPELLDRLKKVGVTVMTPQEVGSEFDRDISSTLLRWNGIPF